MDKTKIISANPMRRLLVVLVFGRLGVRDEFYKTLYSVHNGHRSGILRKNVKL